MQHRPDQAPPRKARLGTWSRVRTSGPQRAACLLFTSACPFGSSPVDGSRRRWRCGSWSAAKGGISEAASAMRSHAVAGAGFERTLTPRRLSSASSHSVRGGPAPARSASRPTARAAVTTSGSSSSAARGRAARACRWGERSLGRILGAVAALGSLVVTLVASGPATATFSGRNGLIAFASDRNALLRHPQIFSLTTRGGPARNLSRSASDESDPAPSPDGRRIAFSRRGGEIWLMNADGGGRRLLTSGGSRPVWSPDGKAIAYDGGGPGECPPPALRCGHTVAVWTVRIDGSRRRLSRRRPDTQAGRRIAAELRTRAGSIPTDPHTGSAWPTPTAGTAAGSRARAHSPFGPAMATRLPSPRTAASGSCWPMEHGGAGSPRTVGLRCGSHVAAGWRIAAGRWPMSAAARPRRCASCAPTATVDTSSHEVSSSTTPGLQLRGPRMGAGSRMQPPTESSSSAPTGAGGSELLASHGGSRSAASPGRLPAESSSARRCVTTTWRFRRSPPTARA